MLPFLSHLAPVTHADELAKNGKTLIHWLLLALAFEATIIATVATRSTTRSSKATLVIVAPILLWCRILHCANGWFDVLGDLFL
jgi:hypothetical protein